MDSPKTPAVSWMNHENARNDFTDAGLSPETARFFPEEFGLVPEVLKSSLEGSGLNPERLKLFPEVLEFSLAGSGFFPEAV